MSDRTINFGESETEATYQIQDTDSTGGGNFVVAKDTNANTVLLQYDPAIDTWEYAGDVDMNGGNVSGVGTLTAESVNTEDVDAESVNTNSLDVGGSPSNRHWELIREEVGDGSIDFTVDVTADRDVIQYIHVVSLFSQEDDVILHLQGDGNDGTDYDYTTVDESHNASSISGDTKFDLLQFFSSFDDQSGLFRLKKSETGSRLLISNLAAESRQFDFDKLKVGRMDSGYQEDITLFSSGGPVDNYHIQVYEEDLR